MSTAFQMAPGEFCFEWYPLLCLIASCIRCTFSVTSCGSRAMSVKREPNGEADDRDEMVKQRSVKCPVLTWKARCDPASWTVLVKLVGACSVHRRQKDTSPFATETEESGRVSTLRRFGDRSESDDEGCWGTTAASDDGIANKYSKTPDGNASVHLLSDRSTRFMTTSLCAPSKPTATRAVSRPFPPRRVVAFVRGILAHPLHGSATRLGCAESTTA